MIKLLNLCTHKFSELEEEIRNVSLINEQFRLIQRGVDESQHSFEIINRCIRTRRTGNFTTTVDYCRED
jgi:hypothetical protein